jgi:hypothetical protein
VGEVIVHSSGPAADNRIYLRETGVPVHRKEGRLCDCSNAGRYAMAVAREEQGRATVQSTCLIRSPERLGEFSQEVRLDDEGEIINTPVLLA